jgi:hypothetical protein
MLLIAFFCSLPAFWCYMMGFLACEYLEQEGIGSAQETFIDLIWMLLVPFTEHWFVTMDQVDDRQQYFLSARRATYSFWVITALDTVLLGVLILGLEGRGAAIYHKSLRKSQRLIPLHKRTFTRTYHLNEFFHRSFSCSGPFHDVVCLAKNDSSATP